jgi:hypothetical protein
MIESYPKFLVKWVVFWTFIDGLILLAYTPNSSNSSFGTIPNLSQGYWFDAAGILISFITGMSLIFLILGIDRSIKKNEIITNSYNFLIVGLAFF